MLSYRLTRCVSYASLEKEETILTGITIGVDVDEVLANYLQGLRDFLHEKFYRNSLSLEELDKKFPLDTPHFGLADWEHIKGDHKNFVNLHSLAVEDGLFSRLSPVPGGKEWVNRLKDDGNHVRIITSRFVKNGQHSIVLRDTSEWLDFQGIKYDDIAFTSKKAEILADIYVDDGPENIKSFIREQKKFIIFDFGYNQNFAGPRAHTWADAYSIIGDMKRAKNGE